MDDLKLTEGAILPLTDENQRLVNIKLLSLVQAYEPGGIEGLFKRIGQTMKGSEQGALLTAVGLRKAVYRDLKKLKELESQPDKLRTWLKRRKENRMLQIRITPNQFLLNNILSIIGINFEKLFDKSGLPGVVDESIVEYNSNNYTSEIESIEECRRLLLEINDKTDQILRKEERERIRRNYIRRYNDMIECKICYFDLIIGKLGNPTETGFEHDKDKVKIFDNERYQEYYQLTEYLIRKINHKSILHKLFGEIHNQKNDNLLFARLLFPWLMIAIFINIFLSFTKSAIKNNKPIFKISEENLNDFFYQSNLDAVKISEKFVKANKKTLDIIKHINQHKNKITPDRKLCMENEKIFVFFFTHVDSLFKTSRPFLNISNIISSANIFEVLKEIEKFNRGELLFFFLIKPEQLDFIETYIEYIDDIKTRISIGGVL